MNARPRLQAGGTLNPRRDLYIERREDAQLLDLLLDRQYVNVLTSRQMGKSSLMVRTAQALTERHVRCVIVDLAAELGTPRDSDTYFLGLLSKIARDLRISLDLARLWRERPTETVNQRLMRFFREALSQRIADPVVCFLDEIDSTLKLPYTDDLFTAIRGMQNQRPMVPAFERLTFCLLGVATPDELIKDRRTTPYNVGQSIELHDFDERDDLTKLAIALSDDDKVGFRLVKRILYWTGGHPYLTLRLGYGLKQAGACVPRDVDRWIDETFQDLDRIANDIHFQQILRFIEVRLTDSAAVLDVYRRILDRAEENDQRSLAHTELKLSGLVKREARGRLAVRNRIYARMFGRNWLMSLEPMLQAERDRRSLETRERLASLDVTITSAENSEGTRIGLPEGASQAILDEVASLLDAIEPVIELILSHVDVSDFKSIANFTNLKSLDLSRTRIVNATRLANLSKLELLDLSGTQVDSLAPLANLTNLIWLNLSDTPVANAAPLAKLARLHMLQLSGTQIADAAPLANLPNLQWLDLSGTQIADVTALASLTKLRELNLADTQVADAAPLASLTNLDTLDLERTHVADVAPLASLSKLQELNLAGTLVADAGPLTNLTELRSLNLWGTQVANADPLAKLTNLRSLNLWGTQVSEQDVGQLRRQLQTRGNRDVSVLGP